MDTESLALGSSGTWSEPSPGRSLGGSPETLPGGTPGRPAEGSLERSTASTFGVNSWTSQVDEEEACVAGRRGHETL